MGDTIALDGTIGGTVASAAQSAGTAFVVDGVATGFTPTVGQSVTGTGIAAGTTVAGWNGTTKTLTLSQASTADLADNASLKIGGGNGGLTVFAPVAGTPVPALSFTSLGLPTKVATTVVTANVAGNEGDVVSFTYGGQSGQYTIGSTGDATALAFKNALDAVASDATFAVVAVTSGDDYVTIQSDTAGSAWGQLVLVALDPTLRLLLQLSQTELLSLQLPTTFLVSRQILSLSHWLTPSTSRLLLVMTSISLVFLELSLLMVVRMLSSVTRQQTLLLI